MITPLVREQILDLRERSLPPSWLRRGPSEPSRGETIAQGMWQAGTSREFLVVLVAAIRHAREVVLLASFLLAEDQLRDALVEAALRGVRIYVLTASEERLVKPATDDGFDARMVEEHKALLDVLAGHVLLRSAGHLHAKFLVIDPQLGSAYGFLSTANFNRALVESVELGVQLDAAVARALAGWFARVFWTEAEHELVGKGRLAAIGRPPAEPQAPAHPDLLVTCRGVHSLREGVFEVIGRAQEQLLVSSFAFDVDHAVHAALLAAVGRGVAVTVLTRPRPAVHRAVAALAAAGARVVGHDKLHAKAIVSEADALVMTANLDTPSLDRSFEVGLRVRGARALALAATLRGWAEEFPWYYARDLPRGRHVGEFCPADLGLRDGVRTVRDGVLEATWPDLEASSALELDRVPAPALEEGRTSATLHHQIRFRWRVKPPRLPSGASPLLRMVMTTKKDKDGKTVRAQERRPYEPPAYEHKGQRYVVLHDVRGVEAARRLAEELGARVVLP